MKKLIKGGLAINLLTKKMLKFKKKNKSLITKILVLILVISYVQYTKTQVNANDITASNVEIQSSDSNIPNLVDDYDEESVLCQKLEYDAQRDTTELPSKIERELNEVGVFDEEINNLDENTLDELSNSINIKVHISYISVDDKTGKINELDSDEIDDIIDEQIDDGKIDYEETDDNSFLSDIASAIGFLPLNVKAKEPIYEDWDHPKASTSGAMKQTVYACQFSKKGTIYVTAKATWLKEAYYRNKDVFGVSVANADIIAGSYSCLHTATHVTFCNSSYTWDYLSTKPNSWIVGGAGDGIAYTVNLFGNRKKMNARQSIYFGEQYSNEFIQIKFRCKYTSKKNVKLVTHYKHCKTSNSITPSISISTGGLSVDVSGSSKNYYDEITHNAYLVYNHI